MEQLKKLKSSFGIRMIEHAIYWNKTYESHKWRRC